MKFIPVQGTAGWKEHEWWTPDSPWTKFMATLGFTIFKPDDPFIWSTNLDIFSNHRDWEAGGLSLKFYLQSVPYEDRNLITHSHGLQVALYAAKHGALIRSLIDIAGPVRKDMDSTALRAVPNIAFWLHVFDKEWDLVGWLGQLFDGRISLSRKDSFATVNKALPRVDHSHLLHDPAFFHHWKDTILPILEAHAATV